MKGFKKIALLLALTLIIGVFSGFSVAAERAGLQYDFDQTLGRTTADAILLLRHIDGWDDGVITELAGDVSGDGKISVYDAVCFLKLLLNDTFTMEKALKVATYNIKAGYYDVGKTMPYIAEMLREVNADIVCLQEVDHYTNRSKTYQDQMKYLADEAGYPYYQFAPAIQIGSSTVAAPSDATTNLYGHGILSKYPIESFRLIHPTQQGVDAEGKPDEYRVIARYEIRIGDKTLALYNSHLDFDAGRFQYQEVQDNYMVHDQYAVFTADMNERIVDLEQDGCINYDRFDILTDNGGIDHIIVSNDTICAYADETGATGFVVPSKEVPEFIYTKNNVDYTVNKASDHNLWYSYIMLKD